MHAGKPLDALGRLIVEENKRKLDLRIPTALLNFKATAIGEMDDSWDVLTTLSCKYGEEQIDAMLTQHAFEQILRWADIPEQYAQRMTSPQHAPLLRENVQHWLRTSFEKRFVRLLEVPNATEVRAWLPIDVLPRDNYDVMEQILPKLRQPGYEIRSCDLTTRLYLHVTHGQPLSVRDGDEWMAGVLIANSEIGDGPFAIEPFAFRVRDSSAIVCDALADIGDPADASLSDETRKLADAAFWAKAIDKFEAAFEHVEQIVSILRGAADAKLGVPPDRAADSAAQRLNLSTAERDAVLLNLFASGDATVYGLACAVARASQDATSYDRAVELERLAARLLSPFEQGFLELK